jgi:hypothetical protein
MVFSSQVQDVSRGFILFEDESLWEEIINGLTTG